MNKCSSPFATASKTATSFFPQLSWSHLIAHLVSRFAQLRTQTQNTCLSSCARDWTGENTDVTIRHDQEHALGGLTRAVTDRRGHKTFLEFCHLPAIRPLKPSREPNRAAVRWARALRLSLEGRLHRAVRELRTTLKSKWCASEVLCFTETIWARTHGDRDKADKLGAPWSEDSRQGRSEVSHEQLNGCEQPHTEW